MLKMIGMAARWQDGDAGRQAYSLIMEGNCMESSASLDFKAPDKYADTILIVKDTKLYTSSYYLEKISPKISALLTAHVKCDGHYVITLPNVSAAAVESLLAYMLPGAKAFDALKLAEAAKYFEIKWLAELCGKELITQAFHS